VGSLLSPLITCRGYCTLDGCTTGTAREKRYALHSNEVLNSFQRLVTPLPFEGYCIGTPRQPEGTVQTKVPSIFHHPVSSLVKCESTKQLLSNAGETYTSLCSPASALSPRDPHSPLDKCHTPIHISASNTTTTKFPTNPHQSPPQHPLPSHPTPPTAASTPTHLPQCLSPHQ